MSQKELFSAKYLARLAILIALEIVLSRMLSISLWNVKIGFSFVPIVIAAIAFGPLAGALVAGVGDLLGSLLFPIGAYFPGFTLSAILTGACFGIFLYKKKQHSPFAVLLAVLITQFLFSFLLSSLWISILYGTPYLSLLPVRIWQAIAMSGVQLLLIPLMRRKIPALI